MKHQKLFTRILQNLGATVNSVELTNDQLEACLKEARLEFKIFSMKNSTLSKKFLKSLRKLWVEKYTRALATKMLGLVRSKFSGALPIPGCEVYLNSEVFVRTGQEDCKRLLEELKSY